MTLNPILKALSTLRKYDVPALLMGGQACILYGGAEFSRDVDLAVPSSPDGLAPLRMALAELQAEAVYVPPLEPRADEDALAARLDEEERAVRQADREYWAPLRRELEALRRAR